MIHIWASIYLLTRFNTDYAHYGVRSSTDLNWNANYRYIHNKDVSELIVTDLQQKQWNEPFFHPPTQSSGIEHNWASSRNTEKQLNKER